MSYDLRLVISGIYLVVVDAKRHEESASRVDVVFVKHHHHQPRLTFAIEDLNHPPFPDNASHHLSNNGDRFGSVRIDDRNGLSFGTLELGETQLHWPVGEAMGSLAHALDVRQVGLSLDLAGNEASIATGFQLPRGTLHTQDLVSDLETNETQWITRDPENPQQSITTAIADDLVLVRPEMTGAVEITVDGTTFTFHPRKRAELTLCISNDIGSLGRCQPECLSTVSGEGIEDNPFQHLGFLCRLGQGPIVLPEKVSEGETAPNGECNGLIAFSSS